MNANIPVIIAGAGPSGLVLALWLAKRGVRVRIIDKSPVPGLTSRALAVQARTLELYRQLGLAEKLVAAGITAKEITMRRQGREVARAKVGAFGEGQSPFPYLLFCSQDIHEELLCRELEAEGVRVERHTELVSFQQDGEGVDLLLRGPGGEERARALYLAGCDGAHSTVRKGLGLAFPGGTYSQVFFVADAQTNAEGRGLEICLSPEDFCIVMPIRQKNSVRLTGTVPPEHEKKEKIDFAEVAAAVKRNTGLEVEKINWFSTYHVHHRVVDHFRQARVFLVGDAAHIHSPAGGQGMNTGIGDAINLAWKLADVVQGRAAPSLLDSYEPERLAFARVLISTTDTAFRFLTNRSWLGSGFRAYLLPRLFSWLAHWKPFLRFAFRTISQIRIEYRASPLSRRAEGPLRAGDRLPWVSYGREDNFPLGIEWELHTYGEARGKAPGIYARSFMLSDEARKKGLAEALYLVRPDGYIAYIGGEAGLHAYLQRIGWSAGAGSGEMTG
jgi:2-polyprenyl-6-methoxyphenol hydroxylase-like FAD-dependent oxidoreductase